MWLMTHPLAFLFSFFFSLHAARYAERGGDGRQDADGYLNHHFPGFLFHHLFVFRHGLHGLHGFFHEAIIVLFTLAA